jgi:type I restriction enzyme, S subunit
MSYDPPSPNQPEDANTLTSLRSVSLCPQTRERTGGEGAFPRYPAYKDSGLELFKQIPQHWEITRLKNVASLRVSTVDKHVFDDELKVSVCHYVQVYYNRRITNAVAFVEGSVKPSEAAEFALRHNDVVITKDSETPDDIAVATLVAEDIPNLVCGYHLAILRPHPEELDGAFLYYLQESQPLRAYYTVTARGVTRYGLPYGGMASSPVLLPPLPEQRAIAAFLDAETARSDALVAKQEALIATLQEKRRALISHAVTKGLDAAAPMRDSGVPWLGAVPAHWEVASIYARYSVQLGKMLNQEAVQGVSPAPYLRNINVQWGRMDLDDVLEMDFNEDEQQKFSLLPGDILVCEGGEVGRTAIWQGELSDCYFQKALHRLRPLSKISSPYFFYYAMITAASQGVFEAEGNKSTIFHLTADKLKKHRFPFPPDEEQTTIVNYLDTETTAIKLTFR